VQGLPRRSSSGKDGMALDDTASSSGAGGCRCGWRACAARPVNGGSPAAATCSRLARADCGTDPALVGWSLNEPGLVGRKRGSGPHTAAADAGSLPGGVRFESSLLDTRSVSSNSSVTSRRRRSAKEVMCPRSIEADASVRLLLQRDKCVRCGSRRPPRRYPSRPAAAHDRPVGESVREAGWFERATACFCCCATTAP